MFEYTLPVTSQITAIVGTNIETIHVIDLVFRTCLVTRTKGKNVATCGPSLPINCSSNERNKHVCYVLDGVAVK